MAYPIARKLTYPLLRWRLASAEGLANLPPTGPALLVANHVGQQDPLLLSYAVVRTVNRKPRAIAKWKIFHGAFVQRWLQTIPLHADRSQTIADAQRALERGSLVLIYPEGGINSSKVIGKVKTGAARIALATRVPVIPIGLRRTNHPPENEFQHTLDMFVGRLHIRVGEPIDLTQWYGRTVDRPLLEAVNATIMSRVAALAGKTYTV